MEKFDPIEFNYELADDRNDILHYQKVITSENIKFLDIIELAYYTKRNVWIIGVKTMNMKQFASEINFDDYLITLFIGEIKNSFDYRFIMSKIVKDSHKLIQLGC